jgi:hypothetical protein
MPNESNLSYCYVYRPQPGLHHPASQADYVLKRCTPSGAKFIPVVQLQLAKHMVAFPQLHLDACGPADLRRYTVVLERDVGAPPLNSKDPFPNPC